MSKKLARIEVDFNQWYQDVIEAAELAEHGPVRGTMVIRPYAYALWENIQKTLDEKIKETGAENAYFPLFIPESFLKKEAEHVEGFSPELAVVTHAGGKELEEPVVVRPTSETIIYSMFSKWITSWRDLPLKINQWANVVRWEMRTRLFLRTTEFLWQEGHTAHASVEEANDVALEMQAMYKNFAHEYLAIPTIIGEKPESERFAGASHTYTFEGIMPDGKALQMGTSHVLSQSFSKAFDISYQDKDGKSQTPFCTSWGTTTRLIGALIMVHGDERGLVIPPKIAPIQVVIVPIFRTAEEKELVLNTVSKLNETFKTLSIRTKIDLDDRKTPGAKFYHWEMKGVPLRIEIGPRDIQNNQLVCVSRIETDPSKKKTIIALDQVGVRIQSLLHQVQTHLFDRAKSYQKKLWLQGSDLSVFGEKLEKEGCFYQTGWCGSSQCEEKFKQHKATIRCTVTHEKLHELCSVCKSKSACDIIVAKAY